MKHTLKLSAIAVLSVMAVGCATQYADVPTPTRFANSTQHKVQAAQHWQLIAQHFAASVVASLGEKANGKPVFVPQSRGEQAFVEGFRELLITELVQRGVTVATHPKKGALVLDVDYHAYQFSADRAKNTRFYGEATALTAGLWAIGGIATANVASAAGVDAGAKLLATVAGVEGFEWVRNEKLGRGEEASGPVPKTELLLTVSIREDGNIIARNSAVYYAADKDLSLYWDRTGKRAPVLKVYGDCEKGAAKCAR